ncbi:hypothetical protein PLICBS_006662 [Purpureocillium lilacinum]|uniref:uncharacterized protein n=1 Tax=Purpureocillium lilacinum TaxID=33203 RepID=UPI0020836585|nr:hypothetical protein PLICBS_006662 [Purpureocillium lilacinum]
MDASAAAPDAAPPPIPTRHHHVAPSSPPQQEHQHHHHHHQQTPHRSSRGARSPPTSSRRPGSSAAIPPASPEVISNLITSLSVISQPANSHFESLSLPSSPALSGSASGGSFGVDYGAYNRPARDNDAIHRPLSLDELAASPPVVRTSKPPSGFSPLTAPKSPRASAHRSSSHESITGGLRSFIRSGSTHNSRPSSPGSLGGDSAASIGNLSIERGSALSPDLKPRRSHDSWGKKANRNSKGLMYMSSKERLRERELDRKRASGSAPSTSGTNAGMAEPGPASPTGESKLAAAGASRADPFLAGTPISEEEPAGDHGGAEPDVSLGSPKPIPVRDSSLRKTGSKHRKRTSARRSKRDGELVRDDAIIEADEPERSRDSAPKGHARSESDHGLATARSFLLDDEETASPPRAAGQRGLGLDQGAADDDEDGAPYPAISGGRRRSEQHDERSTSRLSGRLSPGPKEALRLTRSSSRLKRLSNGPRSPREPRSGFTSPEPRESQPNPTPAAAYERPDSADSIDDAVESYLCSPRLSQRLRHPQTGRVISFSEVGDPNGSAVFCCVGMGLTRYITAFYDELALTLKLRLITPDRPGVGDSEAYSDGTATPLSWPDDVYAICQALKITKFSILAHSAGAIYALATALRMPQHIRGRIHLLAPWIPPSQMNVFGTSVTSPPTNAIPTSQKILRALPTPFLKAANSSFMTATSSSITSSLPKNARRTKRKAGTGKDAGSTPTRNVTPVMDKENVAYGAQGKDVGVRPESLGPAENMDRMQVPKNMGGNGSPSFNVATRDAAVDKERQVTYDVRLTHAIWALATTGANPAVDLLVCLERRHTIGFRYVDITRPVVIHHGSRDTRVPVENVKWLGKTMRRCEVRVLEGEGHGLMASATVMGSVLMEMSKEWEDWMRATGADGRKEARPRKGTLGR